MYKEHPGFESPKNENIKLWRYTDFIKLISLIDTKKLFFVRSDKLKDPFEGSFTESNIEAIGKNIAIPKNIMKNLSQFNMRVRSNVYINSWHTNKHESAAMWKLYSGPSKGVAIQTTFKRLSDSFISEKHDVFIGEVNYIDYRREQIPRGNIFNPFLYKRKSFEYEKEIRAISANIKNLVAKNPQPEINGIYVPCDLSVLIEKIVISPESPKWLKELINSTCAKYEMEFLVEKSELDMPPQF